MNARHCLIVLSILTYCAGCADDTFVTVSVRTSAGSLDGVAQLRVHVTNASSEDVLAYPGKTSQPLHLDTERPVTLSVEFKGWSGEAAFEVEPLSKDGTPMAYGKTRALVSKHEVTPIVVTVYPATARPEHPQGGVMSGDPLWCGPPAPADSCGPQRTCGVLCSPDTPAASMCYVAGAGGPGDSCTSNGDCAAGSQCFTFGASGCNVMTCRKYCQDDGGCSDSAAFCNVPLPCGSTTFSLCSRPCDPTLTTAHGCAPGLACFRYSGDTTDCACPGFGGVGATCTQNSGCSGQFGCAGCAAGLGCVMPTGTEAGTSNGVCRPMCKPAASGCPSGTSCHPFDDSSRGLFGFCQ